MQDILLFVEHHATLFLLFIIVLIALCIVEFIKSKRSANKVTPARATQLVNHQQAIFLDIRSSDIFLAGHIAGAISLPFNELKDKLKKIEKFKSQPLVLVCAAGADSAKAAIFLTQQGYNIHILTGGIRAWREAQLPLVKG